ncbi:MAG: ferritin-like domain-containing protein [Lachnospiraceae bacterium]|nr:ferritin-like domain-containing protein [Lachnospiraceae bacterium]
MYPYNVKNTRLNISSKEDASKKIMTTSGFRDERLIDMVKTAITNEIVSAKRYMKYADSIDDERSKQILRTIYLDEVKHEKMFRDIYYMLTGEVPEIEYVGEIEVGDNFLLNKFCEEEANLKFYSQIHNASSDPEIRDMMLEILFDETSQPTKLNNIIATMGPQ